MDTRVALVTGSSRGIGHEVARQLAARGDRVVVTSRHAAEAQRAAREVGKGAVAHVLDAGDAKSIDAIAKFIEKEIGQLDVLVNNAAVLIEENSSLEETKAESVEQSFRVNALGPMLLTQKLAPLLRRSGHGRVVNVSSGAGQLSSMTDYAPAYSISKAALNAITILFAHELRDAGVLVNCASPGWVRTDMGGSNAPLSVEEGADTIVWLATLPDDGPTGGFFSRRKKIPW